MRPVGVGIIGSQFIAEIHAEAFKQVSNAKVVAASSPTEAHVKAHYTICVLSHLINRTLTLRLHRHRGDTTKAIVSHERLYETLSSCQIDRIAVENVQLSTYNMTRPNLEQQELLERVGLINLLNRDVVELAKSMTNNGDEV